MATASSDSVMSERLAATLGHVYESTNRRSTLGHHLAAVKAELVKRGWLEVWGWQTNYGDIYMVTPAGCDAYEKYLEAVRESTL